jgi:hypothetical protein
MPKHRTIKPFTLHWERLANDLARNFVDIHPCADCGYPVVRGYVCGNCNSANPERGTKGVVNGE